MLRRFLFPASRLRAPCGTCAALRSRLLSAATTDGTATDTSFPAFHVCGAGTDVGKTVLSAALVRAATRAGTPLAYIKPVQSGGSDMSDAKFVLSHAVVDGAKPTGVSASTLVEYSAPASPDLAARLEGVEPVSDAGLLSLVRTALEDASASGAVAVVEGAGGVLSPAPSGKPQADVFRPLALPAILVGDPALGGVSNTLAAREALVQRGFDVPAVVFFEDDCPNRENAATVQRLVDADTVASAAGGGKTSVFSAPGLPKDKSVPLSGYFESESANSFFGNLLAHLLAWDRRRMRELSEMSSEASDKFWYPFTQHAAIAPGSTVTAIDSAFGGDFLTYRKDENRLRPMADAIGSWWTTGVGHGHPAVSRAVGAAAGRYGHVMFPEAAHAPAWRLTSILLDGPGRGWASRVFFSDNGSTAVEVSLKMAFRKRRHDVPERSHLPMRIVSQHGAYHGDTLGAMNCAPASDYNSKQTPWYEDRGLAFHIPTIAIVGGVWTCVPAEDGNCGAIDESFPSAEAVFSGDRDGRQYRPRIERVIDEALKRGECDLGALLLEPVMLGAGGMRFVDPAFQRALVGVCRERSIPVVFDEVFTGFWRLGCETAASMLGVKPDIASYGKLLTGGVIPLAVTLATQSVFESFHGETKREALLHGHSYTAHPAGCAAALESLAVYAEAPHFDAKRRQFGDFWEEGIAREVSSLPGVRGVTLLGTIFAVELEASGERGYAATAGARIATLLRECDVFARPLGNVVYVMCSPMSSKEECRAVGRLLYGVVEGQMSVPDDMPEASA